MAPRIRNISADEFRRMFEAPEIQIPQLSITDAINLSNAIAAKDKAERDRLKEDITLAKAQMDLEKARTEQMGVKQMQEGLADPFQNKIAQIEENLAIAEAQETGSEVADPLTIRSTFGQTLPGSEEPIGPVVQPRPELLGETEEFAPVREMTQDQIDATEAQQKVVMGLIAQGKTKEALALLQDSETQYEKAGQATVGNQLIATYVDPTDPTKTIQVPLGEPPKKGQSALSKFAQKSKSLMNIVDELERFDELLIEEGFVGNKGFIRGTLGVFVDKYSGGRSKTLPFLGEIIGVNPEISSADELAQSYGRRVYKDISGDVGNIAFNEGQFAVAFIPRASDTEERRKGKIARLKRFALATSEAVERLKKRLDAGEISLEEFEYQYGEAANKAFSKFSPAKETKGAKKKRPPLSSFRRNK